MASCFLVELLIGSDRFYLYSYFRFLCIYLFHYKSKFCYFRFRVTSVRKSLRIAKSPPPYLPPEMGGRQSSETTVNNHHPATTATSAVTTPQSNGHLTRSKTAASAGAVNICQPLPTVSLFFAIFFVLKL